MDTQEYWNTLFKNMPNKFKTASFYADIIDSIPPEIHLNIIPHLYERPKLQFIAEIPINYITKETCDAALYNIELEDEDPHGFLKRIPDQFKTEEFCMKVLKKYPDNFEYISFDKMTLKICRVALASMDGKHDSDTEDDVPGDSDIPSLELIINSELSYYQSDKLDESDDSDKKYKPTESEKKERLKEEKKRCVLKRLILDTIKRLE